MSKYSLHCLHMQGHFLTLTQHVRWRLHRKKTSGDHGLKGLFQMAKLVAGGQDCLPLTLRKFRLLASSSANSLCSQMVPGLSFPSNQTVIYHVKTL